MNKWYKMKHADMQKFVSALTEKWEVWVPYRIDGKWEFGIYDTGRDLDFPESVIHVSLKNLFFPKRRPIATYDENSKWSLKPVEPEGKPRIVIGLHPCDVAGIEYMDKVFLQSEHKDVMYASERKRTVLIGMLCSEMADNCHCTDRGLTPDATRGMDAAFARITDGYLLKGLTDKGKQVLRSEYLKKVDEVPDKKDWPAGRYVIASPEEFMEMYDDKIWHEMSDICLTCGICTYACPTCVCFLVTDENFKGKGERVTVWDSCQLQSYSRMAGGHNTRKTPASRVRNRTLDKFAYSHLRYGQISCTGCGRCVMVCPLKRSFPQLGARLTERIKDKKKGKSKSGARSKEA
ncbi:MAG: 4Fe-4S dicluster domain-containing protein [candidate division WOR-3 bacterium]|nr:MAG: 4Fe-4S dicluster domain-containing protein [candidate division WOR-3 bacterium]